MRLVLEGGGDHPTQWAALSSVSAKIGCTSETLRKLDNLFQDLAIPVHQGPRSDAQHLVCGETIWLYVPDNVGLGQVKVSL